MKPGSPVVIACPYCGRYAKRKTLLSGSLSGSKLWSDSKREADMLPESPSFVLCKKCDKFYFVKDAKEVERVYQGTWFEEKWRWLDFVESPSFNQYFKALETVPDEKFIRICIWWTYNDYKRKGKGYDITPEMERLNNENLIALLKILPETNDNDLLRKAEAYRNLGQFDNSKELLDRITDDNLIYAKEKLQQEITKKNKRVVRLD